MPRSQVRKIASMGGKASGRKRHDEDDDMDEDETSMIFKQIKSLLIFLSI